MPVLARLLESAGIATILVSMMPHFAQLGGAPRTLGVEFPFAQTMGHDAAQQKRVIAEALHVLATATTPGTIVHSTEAWPIPQKEAYKAWQPAEPSPVIQVMAPKLREMLRNKNREK